MAENHARNYLLPVAIPDMLLTKQRIYFSSIAFLLLRHEFQSIICSAIDNDQRSSEMPLGT